ncbi:MAG: IS66 family transposase [Ktedonobacteraceae bacterium]
MKAEERISWLEEQLKQALAQVQALQEQLAVAQQRIKELEKQKTPPPAFVKANVAKAADEQKTPRKKRAAQYNRARRREKPTRVIEHRISMCGECGSRLGGVSMTRRRQVIEIAPPPPVEVTEHVVYHGWCSHCQKWREAPLQVSAEVIGQGRMGVRIGSLIAYLRTVLRVPVRQIQVYLATLHQLKISTGEIVEVLHRLSRQMEPQMEALKAAIRTSPAVQADETGWREDGKNGSIWSVSTPEVRYYEYHHFRGSEVVKQLLGESFEGVLGSDFYASYTIYQGLHQRCWVHLLRDGHELKEQYHDDPQVQQWAQDVKAVYERAVAYPGPDGSLPAAKQEAQRRKHQHAFEQELWQLCLPYAHTPSPLHTLCERIERFLPELFVFVAFPGVPAHNNLAERSVRPLVIARKMSGGSRSPKGSDTRMDLFSLFGTWTAQGLNPFFQCLTELSQKHS